MNRDTSRRAWRAAPFLVALTLTASACFDGDDNGSETSADTEEAANEAEEEASQSNDEAADEETNDDDEVTDTTQGTDDTGEEVTHTTQGTDEADEEDEPTSTTEGTEEEEEVEVSSSVDEAQAREALTNLMYSVPSASHVCSPMSSTWQPDAFVAYVAPADGGDIYALCVLPPGTDAFSGSAAREPFDSASIEIITPDGVVVVDVSIDKYPAIGEVGLAGDYEPAVQMVVTYDDGRRRAHGVYNLGAGDVLYPNISFPFFLPHDRPVGEWSFTFENPTGLHRASFTIDAPCGASGSADDLPTDLLDWSGRAIYHTLDTERSLVNEIFEPPPFSHCRIVPDVTGLPIDEAVALMDQFAAVNGYASEISIRSSDCPTGLVEGQVYGGSGMININSVYRLRLGRELMGRDVASDKVHSVILEDGPTFGCEEAD